MSRPSRVVPVEYGTYRDVVDERQACTGCGYRTDAASEAAGERGRPKQGDASLCLNCGVWEVFTGDGLRRRAAGPLELAELRADPELVRLQRLVLHRGRFWPRSS